MIDGNPQRMQRGERIERTLHDELLFELPRALVGKVTPRIREIMEQAYPLAVPLEVSVASGPNWQDLTEIP